MALDATMLKKEAEETLRAILLIFLAIGFLLFLFVLFISFFEIRDWPNSTTHFRSSNFISLISRSKELDGIAMSAIDFWCVVPLFAFACILYAKRPQWASKAFPWICLAAFAPGIWSHFVYMPAHEGPQIGEPFFWGNCMFLFAGVALALLLAFATWLSDKKRTNADDPV